jgi:hypothetical protein
MAYNKFTLEKVIDEFQIKVVAWDDVLVDILPKTPSDFLQAVLKEYAPLGMAIGTEKARSEYIIAPILAELRNITNKQISIFSGKTMNVDKKLGLTGVCDYLLSKDPEQYALRFPIVAIVEAKQDNLEGGVGQCAAEMIAATMLNKRKNKSTEVMYGVVTTGNMWKFLKLEGNMLYNQTAPVSMTQLDIILGVLYKMIA